MTRPKTIPRLRQTVTSFRKGLLGVRDSHSMCYAVCWPLQSYLGSIGQLTELCEGYVNGKHVHHYWLRLPDGRIIDPTADQFNARSPKRMPSVYIGEQPSWYAAKIKPCNGAPNGAHSNYKPQTTNEEKQTYQSSDHGSSGQPKFNVAPVQKRAQRCRAANRNHYA